ncbi:hypothetical protein C8J57DRAFT_1212626 [Mycena rebaudengoi]|nr:hypothetical protein C8J57DRAFT_1227790 [Mycena rebaudengoi]KAJ7292223.1 hypothetical protein C8J57DRAFT_1212626 [Mycena rebaudengoi]
MPVFSRILPPQEIDPKFAAWNAGHVVIRRQTDDTFALCVNGNWSLITAKTVLLYIVWNARIYCRPTEVVGPGPVGFEIFVATMNRLEPQGAPWARWDVNLLRNVLPPPRGQEIATPQSWMLRASDMGETYKAPTGMRLITEKMYLHYLEGAAYREEKRVTAQNERRGKKADKELDDEFAFITPGFADRRAEEESYIEEHHTGDARNPTPEREEETPPVDAVNPTASGSGPAKRKTSGGKSKAKRAKVGASDEGMEVEQDGMEEDAA